MVLTARYVAKRIGHFFLPICIVALYCLILYLWLDWDTFSRIGILMILYLLTPIGKYILIPGALLVGVPGWLGFHMSSLQDIHGTSSPVLDIGLVAFSVAFVDTMTSLFLVYNFDMLEAIPWLGPHLKRLQERGKERLRRKQGGEQLAFLGLTGFVSLSVQGSGGISSTILGRVAGMRNSYIVGALFVGSLAGCTAIATTSYYAGGAFIDAFGRGLLEIIGYSVLIAAMAYLIYYYWKE